MKLSEKMIVPNQQKEENFLMKVSRPPTSNKRPTTNHLQKSPNRGHRVIYVKKDVEQRPSTTSSIVPQYKTPRYVPVTYPSVRKTNSLSLSLSLIYIYLYMRYININEMYKLYFCLYTIYL